MVGDRQSFGHNSFQLIRLVLAVAVLYRHSFDLLATGHADVVLDLIPPRTHLGRIALCFFMVVSGFLVAHSWTQSAGWRDFLWRRVLRVYPAFVVASVLSAFVAAPLGSRDPAGYLAAIDILGFLVNTLQLNKLAVQPSFLENPYPGPINGSLWSIKIEFECYLGLMALGLVGVFRRRALMLGLFGLMLVAHAVQPYVPSSLDRYAHHLQLSTFFMSGVVAYLYRERIGRGYGWWEVAALTTVATAILEVGFVELLPLTGTYLLLYLAYEPRLLRLQVGRRVDLSYGIYLYAWPVQQLLIQTVGGWLNPYTLSVAALVGSGALAWLSWSLVERPFLALKQRTKEAREEPPPPAPPIMPTMGPPTPTACAGEGSAINHHRVGPDVPSSVRGRGEHERE
jgi:peptidoglycan/LPS O-acetylase OafA/YrhL